MRKRLLATLFAFFFAVAGPLKAEDPHSEPESAHEKALPLLGETQIYLNLRSTRETLIFSTGCDLCLDLTPVINPCVFVEYYRARFTKTHFSENYDLSEVWVGGGARIDLVPRWFWLAPMVGTHFVVKPDDHLNRKLFDHPLRSDRTDGVLVHFVAELKPPEKWFTAHFEADYNNYLEHGQYFQIYHGRLAVPLAEVFPFAFDVGIQSNYFYDSQLRYQEFDLIPTLGVEIGFGRTASIDIDVGVGFADEKNPAIRGGRHQSSVIVTFNVAAIYW